MTYVHCKEPRSSGNCKCSAIGDPHYKTYDGQTIHFFGRCKYLLTEYTRKHDRCSFKVIVENEAKGHHSKLTCTRAAYVHMFGDVFEIGHGLGLKVNGVHKNIPYEKGVEVRIFFSGKLLQFVAPKCGVNVAFDGDCNLFAEVSRRYGGQMTGICGNCDGHRNEFRTKSGEDVSLNPNKYNLIGDSYAVSDKKRRCHRTPFFNLKTVCKGEWRKKIRELKQCGSLLAHSGPFVQCASHGKVNLRDFYRDCKIDVCSSRHNEHSREKSRCKILEGLAESCAETGHPGIRWRSFLNCPLTCGANQHFTAQATPCPRTCENHFYGTKEPCYHLPEREGCVCNDGYLRDGSVCVKPSQCTCIDLCIDRVNQKKCAVWKEQGKCQKFQVQMQLLCKRTCKFCRVTSHDCQDEINTWKCIQFRDEGKCAEDFYKTICGLTCNYDKCACEKDKTIIGPCDKIERQQTITHVHFVRNSHGKCVKRVFQRTRVCNCPFVYRIHRSRCNHCTGKSTVTVFTQKKVLRHCVRRSTHYFIRCSRCQPHARRHISCLHNNLEIITTLFNRRIGCFQCVPATTSNSRTIKCRKTVLEEKCNKRTCIKTITHIVRRPEHCRCVEHRFSRSALCCCIPKFKDVKPFCSNGKIVHRRIEHRLHNGVCRPYFKDRSEIPVCKKPRPFQGHCRRNRGRKLHCIALDRYYKAYVNNKCQCLIGYRSHYRTCCCKKPETYRTCDKALGVIETVTISYKLTKKGRYHFCKKNVKRSSRTIFFQTQYLRKIGKCSKNCLRTDTITKKYRRGCGIKEVFERLETRLCCCLPGQLTKSICVANYLLVVERYRRILVGRQCFNFLFSRHRRLTYCPPTKITRTSCIYRGYKRLVTVVIHLPFKCRCVRRQRSYKEQCRPCPYKFFQTKKTACNVNTCLRKINTYFRDVDCKYKVRRCDELCCCKQKPWQRKYCDENSGVSYSISYWYKFNDESKTCSLLSKKISNSVACIGIVKVVTGKVCGRHNKDHIKRTITRYVLDKATCSCKPLVTVHWLICKCHSTEYSPWKCVNNHFVLYVTTHSINIRHNRCDSRRFKLLRCLTCPRPRHDETVHLHRCKYAVYRYFYQIINCKCHLSRTRSIFVKCCRKPRKVVTRCIKSNILVTRVITYKVRPDLRKCIAVISIHPRFIKCSAYVKKSRTPCVNGRYIKIFVYFEVRHCTCIKARVRKISIICDCFPKAPVVKKTCLGTRWRITVTRLKLHHRQCVPCSTNSDVFIHCSPYRVTRGPCNHKSGLIRVRVVDHVIIHCQCRRVIRYYYIKCPCWKRDRIVRPPCISNTRVVRRERFMEVNGHCKWVVKATEVEECRCPRTTWITKCFNNSIWRTKITNYVLALVNLKISVKRCRKRVVEQVKPVICNRHYQYTTPCKNFRQLIVSCSYHSVKCRCQERCRLRCVRACDCRRMNYCQTKCIRNMKYRVCHKFKVIGRGCSKQGNKCQRYVSRTSIPVRCSPPFIPRICSKCTIRHHNGFYRRCTQYFVAYQNCRCYIKSRSFKELCHCRPKVTSRRVCHWNNYVTTTTYYVIVRGRCVPKISRFVHATNCPKSFLTVRNLQCSVEYRLTYYHKENCHCIRRTFIKYNSKCCHRRTISKYCKDNLKVYVERRFVQQSSNIALFPGHPYSHKATFCQIIKRRWTRYDSCGLDYVITWCNKATLRMHLEIHYYRKVNCICVKKIYTHYGHCKICRKKSVHRSKCGPRDRRGYGYIEITKTYLKVTRQNLCKKVIKHKREICRCPRRQSRTFCERGYIVTETVRYDIHSRPPCAKLVSSTRRSVHCYNHGKKHKWRQVGIKYCRHPGEYTVAFFERDVLNKATCGCSKVTKTKKKAICCRRCINRRKCVRNVKIFTKTCERAKGLHCVRYSTSRAVRVLCWSHTKTLIGRCIRGHQKYSLTTYRSVHCKCRRKIVFKSERCKCFPKESRICVSTKVKVTKTSYLLVRGRCHPIVKTLYENIYCIQTVTFKDFPAGKCRFVRKYYNKIVVNCKCVQNPNSIAQETLYYCCNPPTYVKQCKNHQMRVIIKQYSVLVHFHCIPKKIITERPIHCRKIGLVETRKHGRCIIKYSFFKLIHRNCHCHRKKVRDLVKRICCPPPHYKPYTVTVCDKRKGSLITTHYHYYAGIDGHCHKMARVTTVKVACNRLVCRAEIGHCLRNTRIARLYCMKSVHCKCVLKLVIQVYECCTRGNFHSQVQGKCIGYFQTITYYAYRLNKRSKECRKVIIRVQRKRCRCPRNHVIRRCLKDVNVQTIYVAFQLDYARGVCIKTKKEHIAAINGCHKKNRLVGIVGETCNRHTGRGTVTYEYIHAEKCECKRTRKTKPIICICQIAFPPRTRTYCRYDKVTVQKTVRADCRRNVVKLITTIYETKITNCDKVVVEKSACFPEKVGVAISVRYVTKIQYNTRNCKCYRKVIQRRKQHCRCRRSWSRTRCERQRFVIIIATIYKRKGLCHKSVKRQIRNVPCPHHPHVTKTRCRNNKYQIIVRTYFRRNCKCLSRVAVNSCNCVCPRKVVRRRCTRHYVIEIRSTTWRMIGCKCVKNVTISQKIRPCPRFVKESRGPCVKRGDHSYRTITTRHAVIVPRLCKCIIHKSIRSVICSCLGQIKHRKYCIRNHIIVSETWKYVINFSRNRCELAKITGVNVGVLCPKTVKIYNCNKVTGKETITTISFTVVRCRVKKNVRVQIFDCVCTKEWKLVKSGECSGPPHCQRTDIYVRQVLRRRRCVNVKELKQERCCCHPSHKLTKYCKHNRKYTVTVTFAPINGVCRGTSHVSVSGVPCQPNISIKETKCSKQGFKIISFYGNWLSKCKCVLRLIRQRMCRCRCGRSRVVHRCHKRKGIATTIVITHSLVNCECVKKVHRTLVRIVCPRNREEVSRCLRVKIRNYYVRITTRIMFRVDHRCKCAFVRQIYSKICKCVRDEHTVKLCEKSGHVITLRRTYTVLRSGQCVTKVRNRRYPILCRPSHWLLKSDSGCQLDYRYGQRVMTYVRRIAVGCHCKQVTKVFRCNCRCTGPRLRSQCYNHKIMHTHYSYHMDRCRCVRRRRIQWEFITCRPLPPRVEKCRRVSKHFYLEYTVNRHAFARNCRCMVMQHRVARVCKCRSGFSYRRCNRNTNVWSHVSVWFELRSNRCLRHSKTVMKVAACDLSPQCHVISRCRQGSQTQRYECLERYRENCRCYRRKTQYVHRCECKPKKIIHGHCNSKTCFKKITIITFNLLVLSNNRKKCIASKQVIRERCGCCIKPSHSTECIHNKLIKRNISYHFNKVTKNCDRTVSIIDQTPRCQPAKEVHRGQCNRHSCIRRVKITRRILQQCRCVVTHSVKSKECCCKKKDYSTRECIRGNIFKTTTYTFRFVQHHCKKYSLEKYERAKCPVDTVRYGRCYKSTLRQKKVVKRYSLSNCQCIPKIIIKELICGCPRPFITRKCIQKTGAIQTVYTFYSFYRRMRKCYKYWMQSQRLTFCQTRPTTTCGACNIRIGRGTYKQCIKRFEVRIGCQCFRRSTIKYKLCHCPRQYRYVVCKNPFRVTMEEYFVKVSNRRKNIDFSCVRRIRVVSKYVLDCLKSRITRGHCVNRVRTYTLEYYRLIHCSCVRRVKVFRVLCTCDRPRVISRRCLYDVTKEKRIRYYSLACNKKAIPNCRCVSFDRVHRQEISCSKPLFKVTQCKHDKKTLTSIHYEPRQCKCFKVKYVTKLKCEDDCYDMPHCDKIKKLGLCNEPIYNQFECQKTCGYCKPCPEDRVEKFIGKCKCFNYDGMKLCTRKTIVKRYLTIDGQCTHKSHAYRSFCNCLDTVPQRKCEALKREGQCKNRSVWRHCERTCNPNCRIPCHGELRRRHCVQSGVHKGKYKVIVIHFFSLGHVCLMRTRVYHRGLCDLCSKKVRKEVTECINNVRYVLIHYVVKHYDECANKVKRIPHSCKDCSPTTETLVGRCNQGRRTVVTVFWENIKDCCKKVTLSRVYRCNRRCASVKHIRSRCVLNKRMEFKIWKSGKSCESHVAQSLVSCVPGAN